MFQKHQEDIKIMPKIIKTKYLILGSGVGGLSAGANLKKLDEDFIIVDKQEKLPNNLSNGLHYRHSTDLKLPFHTDFKSCILTENVWDPRTNKFSNYSFLPEMFEYSKKIMEDLRHPSSIMDPGKRNCVWVPESNNMNDLLNQCHDYIGSEHFKFGFSLASVAKEMKTAIFKNSKDEVMNVEYEYLITTMPVDKFVEIAKIEHNLEFKFKNLNMTNYKPKNIVPNWMIVLYISDPKFIPYRISCFNNVISMESLKELKYEDEIIVKYLLRDLFDYDLESKEVYEWKSGRIFGISKDERMKIVKEMIDCDIYPVGRFALWNGKIRMDDTARQAHDVVELIKVNIFDKSEQEIIECIYGQ